MDDTAQSDMGKDVGDDVKETVMSCEPNIANNGVQASSQKI